MTITKSELRRQIRILTDWGVPISYVEPMCFNTGNMFSLGAELPTCQIEEIVKRIKEGKQQCQVMQSTTNKLS